MLLDVNSPLPNESINRAQPWTTYDSDYLNRTFAVVEAFKNYPNTLLFFAGNEVINDDASGSVVPPYMRVSFPLLNFYAHGTLLCSNNPQAVTRDLKNYIKKNSARAIPVGYSAADVRDILVDTWNYLQCTTTGDDSDPSRVDVFALNSYSWCGDSSFTTSGYNVLMSDLTGSSVPVFFSEYGCNVPAPRVFTEVPVIYGPLMTPVLSGGMVYEFSQEASNFGLVNINSDGSVNLLPDYATLQKQFSSLNVTSLQGSAASQKDTAAAPPQCSDSLIAASSFNSNFTLPAVPPGAQALIDNGIAHAPVGKIVHVTKTSVSQTVKDAQGNVMSGLSILPLSNDQSNNPSTVSSTTSASTPSSTKKSAAPSGAGMRNWLGLVVAGVVAVVCVAL